MTKVGDRKLPPKVFEYRSFQSYEKKALITDLEQVPWKEIDRVGDIDDTVFLWETLFKECADHHELLGIRQSFGSETRSGLSSKKGIIFKHSVSWGNVLKVEKF